MTTLILFVGQGTQKNNHKNMLKAKLYKAYSIFNKYSFCLTTSNKKNGFVMLRHARTRPIRLEILKGHISNGILYLVLQISIKIHHKLGFKLYGRSFTSFLTNGYFVRLRKTKCRYML